MPRRVKNHKPPTQSDVARLAGVSVPVVSAVINGSRGTVRVSSDVAETVKKIIAKIGYAPNPIARSLVNAQRNIIGVFTFDTTFPYKRQNFFYPFFQGIEEEIEGSGFDLLLFTAAHTLGERRSLYANGANRLALADGAIILGEDQNKEELTRLAELGFPFVVLGRRDIPGVELNYVAAAYAATVERIVSHAWAMGHRRFCYFGRPGANERQLDRIAGFRSGLERRGCDAGPSVRTVDMQTDWVGSAVQHARSHDTTMIFAEDAEIAEALDRQISATGLRVPEDISIVTLADPTSDHGKQRRFTRLAVPREAMGAEGVRMLFDLLEGAVEPITRVLECDFVEGTTICPPAVR